MAVDRRTEWPRRPVAVHGPTSDRGRGPARPARRGLAPRRRWRSRRHRHRLRTRAVGRAGLRQAGPLGEQRDRAPMPRRATTVPMRVGTPATGRARPRRGPASPASGWTGGTGRGAGPAGDPGAVLRRRPFPPRAQPRGGPRRPAGELWAEPQAAIPALAGLTRPPRPGPARRRSTPCWPPPSAPPRPARVGPAARRRRTGSGRCRWPPPR